MSASDITNTHALPLPGAGKTLAARQFEKLGALLTKISFSDNFNRRRLRDAGLQTAATSITSLGEFFQRVPFTTKPDILADRRAHPPFGSNFTDPPSRYTRFCQTTGTQTGEPLMVLDTPASWEAMLACWRTVFKASGVKAGDRIFFAFSFGPFLGFWTAFEAAALDCMVIPGGGLSSQARLEMMARTEASVLCCTPTYALRLGENIGVSSGVGIDQIKVRRIIVAGEPGGSLPTVRARLKELWRGAKIFDHHGMSEVGPVSYEDPDRPASLCVIEDAYLAEIINPQTGAEVGDGEEGELVLTTLDRVSCPLLRYRTGDWVCKHRVGEKLYLEGGVLGRTDDMAVVRGVNLYPSAIENVVRRFSEVAEFQVEHRKRDAMDEIELLVELEPGVDEEVLDRLQGRLRDTLSLRIPVRSSPPGSLPRFDFKARRWRRV
jgi:phenylacetate-CoA ligase